MKPPNSEKPLIMKFFQYTICIHFNTFEPLNKENLQKNWLSQNFYYSEVPLYMLTWGGVSRVVVVMV